LHWDVTKARAALAVTVLVGAALVMVSGGSGADPRAPQFLSIAGVGERGWTVVVDSLGNVVGRRRPGPAAGTAWRWVNRARPLGGAAPPWARQMYRRSLLVLRALTDWRSGAVIAGARQGWAYVWPRDAATVALALAGAGYRVEAQRVTRFLLGLDLDAAARFYRDGTPVPVRGAQADAAGWVRIAATAAAFPIPGANEADTHPARVATPAPHTWRDRADYQEGSPDDYLANAIASLPAGGPKASISRTESAHRRESNGVQRLFETPGGLLTREAGDPDSGLDSAVAWAVRPFPHPALFPLVRRSLNRLVAHQTRFGILPSEDWPGADPWTAPTAWTAWSLAVLGERRRALSLMGDLRRAATPAGLLPERVDVRTGVPRSTTPLAWSHAFAILAIRRLWP
jgi:Glycosyl hydrolases family 15